MRVRVIRRVWLSALAGILAGSLTWVEAQRGGSAVAIDPDGCARALLDGLPPVMWFIRRQVRRHRSHRTRARVSSHGSSHAWAHGGCGAFSPR